MTNYSFEEFKAWLEGKDLENKPFLPNFFSMCQNKGIKLEQFASINWGSHNCLDFGNQITKLLQEWKAEVDQRERERESKAKMRRKTLIW